MKVLSPFYGVCINDFVCYLWQPYLFIINLPCNTVYHVSLLKLGTRSQFRCRRGQDFLMFRRAEKQLTMGDSNCHKKLSYR